MHKPILKRCGIVLLALGALDLIGLIRAIVVGHSYSATLTFIGIVGGVYLVRGSLKAARWIAIITSFMLATGAVAIVGMVALFPFGYFVAVLKSSGGAWFSFFLASVIFATFYWVRKQLYRTEVAQAQLDAGVPRPKKAPSIASGLALALVLIVSLSFAFRSDTAGEAKRRVRAELGPSYEYVVTSLSVSSGGGSRTVSARVAAYNDAELKTLSIGWSD